jgi:dipeptidyl aminopeptidase/acylaminoacyl peptidase
MPRRFTLCAALLAASALGAQAPAPAAAPARAAAPMDSARAARLYVSDRPEDHPQPDFERQRRAKARVDSTYAARAAGAMRFRKASYRSPADGLEVPVYVFAPPAARGARAHPALVWVHGGVHGTWDEQYLPFVREAVGRGYVVVAPDYRGSTGYGAAHYNAIDYGGKEVDDVLGAHAFLATLPEVDTARVGVMGWSHGGFIAAHLLFRGRTPFRSGAAIVPVTNLVFRLSYKGPNYQRSFATQAGLRGLPFERRDEYVRRSPYYHVDSLRVPMLVHVASNDTDVDFVEARPLVDALAARKPGLAETKIYWDPTPGPVSVGHTFSRRVNRETLERDDSPEQVDSWDRTWAFFARTLGAPAGAPPAARPAAAGGAGAAAGRP